MPFLSSSEHKRRKVQAFLRIKYTHPLRPVYLMCTRRNKIHSAVFSSDINGNLAECLHGIAVQPYIRAVFLVVRILQLCNLVYRHNRPGFVVYTHYGYQNRFVVKRSGKLLKIQSAKPVNTDIIDLVSHGFQSFCRFENGRMLYGGNDYFVSSSFLCLRRSHENRIVRFRSTGSEINLIFPRTKAFCHCLSGIFDFFFRLQSKRMKRRRIAEIVLHCLRHCCGNRIIRSGCGTVIQIN